MLCLNTRCSTWYILATHKQKLTQLFGRRAVFRCCHTISILIHHFGKKQLRCVRHVGNGNHCRGFIIIRFYFCFPNRIVHRVEITVPYQIYAIAGQGLSQERVQVKVLVTTLAQFKLHNWNNKFWTIESGISYVTLSSPPESIPLLLKTSARRAENVHYMLNWGLFLLRRVQ